MGFFFFFFSRDDRHKRSLNSNMAVAGRDWDRSDLSGMQMPTEFPEARRHSVFPSILASAHTHTQGMQSQCFSIVLRDNFAVSFLKRRRLNYICPGNGTSSESSEGRKGGKKKERIFMA